MKVAYLRVSSQEQNLQMQIDAFKKEGCEKIFEEKKSALAERPILHEAIEYLRKGDVLYIWALDRLGRDIFDIFENVKSIHNKGAFLRIHVQNIDTTTPTGKILLTFFAMMAETEIVLKKERCRAGIESARSRGVKLGRKPGLSPESVEKAKRAEKLYKSKDPVYSVREICNILNISLRTLYKYLYYNKVDKRSSLND